MNLPGHGGDGATDELDRLLRRAEEEQPQTRLRVHQVLEERLGLVDEVADAVAVLVVPGVVAPEVAALTFSRSDCRRAPPGDRHLVDVVDEVVLN